MSYRNMLIAAAVGVTVALPGVAAAYERIVQKDEYQEYMSKLEAGKITPMGSKRAGGANGIIPAWNCKGNGIPPHISVDPSVKEATSFPAFKQFPFMNEEPRFVITIDNYKKYKDKLTPGTIKLLKSYPEEFKIRVFPTHRTGCNPTEYTEAVALNAKYGRLVDNGNGATGVKLSKPFPLPNNALEAVKNNAFPPNPFYEEGNYVGVAIFPERREFKLSHKIQRNYYNDPTISREEYYSWDKQVFSVFVLKTLQPERARGTTQLGFSYIRPTKWLRTTWQYQPGTRRVRRFPYFGFDTPQGAGGLRGVDEQRVYNGSPEKFNWKIKGIKPMIVRYNAYGVYNADTYQELLGNHVVNPKYMRWELHRVRVVEATLKEGEQHWYQRRVFYQDMDTGHFLMSDSYDHQGVLWRTNMQNYVWTPTMNMQFSSINAFYDFIANAYTAQRLIQEVPEAKKPVLNTKHIPRSEYGPAKLRRMSIR